MDTSDQVMPTEPAPAPKQTLLQRVRDAWQSAKAKAADWWDTDGRNVMFVASGVVAFSLSVWLVGFGINWWAERSHAPAAVAQTVGAAPGMQDQIDALRLRVIVLEARADAAQPASKAPASAPRSRAARPAASADIPATESTPTAPPKRWGTTDLDREIAAFPSTSLEQAK